MVVAGVCALVSAPAPRTARACGGEPDGIEELTTFDPGVLGDPAEEALFYEPSTAGVGREPCKTCAADEMRADWEAFFGPSVPSVPSVSWKDWSKILFDARPADIDALIVALKAKGAHGQPAPAPASPPPRGFESNAILADVVAVSDADRERAIAALYFAGFARRVEPFAAAPPSPWGPPPPAPAAPSPLDGAALQEAGDRALARAKLPFLRQRYAFQLTRLRFYRRDWRGVIAFAAAHARELEAPSRALGWRAQYYVAGALRRSGELPRANLLFARIHAGWPALALETANDFQPMQEADWQATLALAASVKEKVELWRLVGLKLDALAAMEKMIALDPRSTRIGLLAVREINRREADASDLAALEALARALGDDPRGGQAWLFDLIAGHAAALRGDPTAARLRTERAMRARPRDPRVANQAHASLALALARSWKRPDRPLEDEIASQVSAIAPDFSRGGAVTGHVRAALADAFKKQGMCVEAELLGAAACPASWQSPKFVQTMIARASAPATAFDRFMLAGSHYNRDSLRLELGLLDFVRGDLAEARRVLDAPGVGTAPLGTDPFLIHILDCHDCDHQLGGAKWTRASFVRRMIELRAAAERPGEAGAAAAFQLGNGYYNITYFGNARSFLESSHATAASRSAELWYKRAFERSTNREAKVKAAFMAAKSELGRLLEPSLSQPSYSFPRDELPVPATWFPIVSTFADTAYYREILAECGHYRRWAR